MRRVVIVAFVLVALTGVDAFGGALTAQQPSRSAMTRRGAGNGPGFGTKTVAVLRPDASRAVDLGEKS